jgi:hypothetical protein
LFDDNCMAAGNRDYTCSKFPLIRTLAAKL